MTLCTYDPIGTSVGIKGAHGTENEILFLQS